MSTCVYRCLPGCYNWNIIFRGGGSFTDDDDIVLELKRVSKALDGTYSLNPISPTEQTWSGGGDPYWPQRREELVNSAKIMMITKALRDGVSRWIGNAVKYLNSKDITNEYEVQFPEMYNYLTYNNNIPYERMKRIHYEIVETIT